MSTEVLPPLVVHVIFALGTGGLENGLINLINRMPAERYRHAIICLTDIGEFANRIQRSDIQILSVDKKQGHDFPVYWRIWKALRKLKPQIVHTRNFVALESQIPAFFTLGTKRVHGEHGRDMQDLHGQNKKQQLVRRVIQPLVDRYITVSLDLQRWLVNEVQLPAEKIQQIYNGVDCDLFYPRSQRCIDKAPIDFIPDDGLVIGTVGRLAEVKNQRLLIDAFAELLTSCPELKSKVRLIIVGDGAMRDRLESKVDENGLTELVWFAGDRDDVPDMMRLFDLFILPSLAEGISNTVLEAMATRLPIIAADVGGNPELVKSGVNGYLFTSNDAKELSKKLFRLIDDKCKMDRMGEASLRRIHETFSWDKMVASYTAIYDNLLGS